MGKIKRNLIVICGQTATGKSDLAIRIARRIGAEIISADAMQVYKGMEFLTFPPKESQRKQIPHYFISCVDPKDEYNVAKFVRQAYSVASEIWDKGKTVIVVGGTGLYIKCLLEGIFFMEFTIDESVRKELLSRWEKGFDLYAELLSIDLEAAKKIHCNDMRRIIRALEVYYQTGLPISYWWSKREFGLLNLVDHLSCYVLFAERELLKRRIKERVDRLSLDDVNKFAELAKSGLSKTSSRVIGCSAFMNVLNGIFSLEQAKLDIIKQTYHYARRQKIWFRRQLNNIKGHKKVIELGVDLDPDKLWKELF